MREVLNFEKLRLRYQSNDIETLKAYLCEIFNELSDTKIYKTKNTENIEKTVNKDSFVTYIGLPYIIGERVFIYLAKGNKKVIKCKEFVEGLSTLYNGSLAETQMIVFNILDFDNDGYIVAQDLRLFLSLLYFQNEEQIKTSSEINKIIDKFFADNRQMTFKTFIKVVENRYSDIFLILTCFLYEHKFYDAKSLEIYSSDRNKLDTVLLNYYSTHNKKRKMKETKKTLVIPKNFIKGEFGIQTDFKKFLIGETPRDKQMEAELDELESCEISDITFEHVIAKPSINYINYKNEYRAKLIDKKSSNTLCRNYKNSLISAESKDTKSTKMSINSHEDSFTLTKGDLEGYVHNLTEGRKKFWLVLIGKDLLYFKKNDKHVLKGLHNLSNAFLIDNIKEVEKDNIKFYCFSIMFPKKERIFGFKNLEQCKIWLNILKANMSHRCIDDYYELQQVIGQGGYGVVKLGYCKKTGKAVAIKIVEKAKYKHKIGLVKNELEILKFCKHENIVQYIDNFETPEYIYIITEYLKGGDLINYLDFNNFTLHENRAKHIVKQIALGVEYLHYYGIIHRDLKPLNILVSDLSPYPKVKIIDFGLSKMSGFNEVSNEVLGTVHFSAPEVLQRKGYNCKIDLWSLGVLLYFLILGKLPFDDDYENEMGVVNTILRGEYIMPKLLNFDVKSLISCCLEKDADKRISIKDFLDHSWFY
jgi:hypothetical protein